MAPVIGGLSELTLIGRGGSAKVYAATRDAFGDRVAVKVLNDALTDEMAQRHFEKEAESLRYLADVPGVVAVLESGVTTEGDPYLVMPLFEGGSSERLVSEEHPMAWHEAARLVASAADAVDAAHQRGIWHRDIKPGNILLTSTGRPSVADFGIAKLLANAHTTTGASAFTPRYAAPEVLAGEHTAQSDVYSLGATFVAYVTGQAPFADSSGSVLAIVNEVLTAPPPDLTAFGVPPSVGAIIASAMGKTPGERPQTPGHLAALLREQLGEVAAVSDTPPTVIAPVGAAVSTPPPQATPPVAATHVTPATPASGPPSGGGSNRMTWILVGAALMVLTLIGGGVALALTVFSGSNTTVTADRSEVTVSVDSDRQSAETDPTEVPEPTPASIGQATSVPSPVPSPTTAPEETADGPQIIAVEEDGSGDAADLVDAVAQAQDGDTIQLGAGNHEVEKLVRISRSITVIGAGPALTSIVATDDSTALSIEAADVHVRALSLGTSYQPAAGTETFALLQIVSAANFMVEDVAASDGLHYGLATFGDSTGAVVRSVFDNNATGGLIISQQSDVTLVANQASDNAEGGFVWHEQATGFAALNVASDNQRSGFAIENQSSPLLVGNTSQGNQVDGFTWLDEAGGTAQANFARDNRFDGFAAEELASPVWSANGADANGRNDFFRAAQSAAPEAETIVIGENGVVDLADALSRVSRGGLIELPPGETVITSPIQLPPEVLLSGAGEGQTTLRATGGALILADGVTVSSMTIAGGDEGDAPLIEAGGAQRFAILGVELIGGSSIVLHVDSPGRGVIANSSLASSRRVPFNVEEGAQLIEVAPP